MSNGIYAHIKLRRASAAEWIKENPILHSGEPGVELDTFKFKIGNGVLSWNELPYMSAENVGVSSNNAILVVDELPIIGNELVLYKEKSTQKLFYWDSINETFISLTHENIADNNTDNIVVTNILPDSGQENLLYKLPD